MNKSKLIKFVKDHIDKAPDHLLTALVYNTDVEDQPLQALQYFYDWTTKGEHKRNFGGEATCVEHNEYTDIENTN